MLMVEHCRNRSMTVSQSKPAIPSLPPENIKHEIKPDSQAVEWHYQFAKQSAANEQAVIEALRQMRDEYNQAILDGDRALARIYRQQQVDRQEALDRLWDERGTRPRPRK